MNRTLWVVSLCLGLASAAALARQASDKKTVYVRARDTVVTDKPKADGKRLKTLQPGDELVYLGQDKASPRYHKVELAPKKTGFVYFANISTKAPATETRLENGQPTQLDRKASASFGAAVRGLTPGAENYAKADAKARAVAADSFRWLEKQGDALQAQPDAVAQHRKSAGLQGGVR